MEALIVSFIFFKCCLMILAENLTTVVDLADQLETFNTTENSTKPMLRYGFQKTQECKDFPKAFLCITKCLDFNFDVAYADKNCKCTCYKKPGKAKYKIGSQKNHTKYKLGAPTTSLPYWAQPKTEEPLPGDKDDVAAEHLLQHKNDSDIENSTEMTTTETGEPADGGEETGETGNETEHAEGEEPAGEGGEAPVVEGEPEAEGEAPAEGGESPAAEEGAAPEEAEAAPPEEAEAAPEEADAAPPEE